MKVKNDILQKKAKYKLIAIYLFFELFNLSL